MTHPPPSPDLAHAAERKTRSSPGFTLIEVVGAFFLMVMILGFITGMFIENGRQRDVAQELMRERLSAVAAIELIAADLEGAMLVTPSANSTQQDNPWIFIADETGDSGARRLRFVTQNGPDRAAEHGSSRVEVAYFLEVETDSDQADGGEEQVTLWRWRSPRPPFDSSSRFPDSRTPGAVRIAEGVSDFGVQLTDASGAQLQDWDSSVLPAESALPEQALISLTLLRKARQGESPDGALRVPGHPHTRQLILPMKPIDVATLIELAGDGDNELACKTIQDCVDQGEADWYMDEIDSNCGGDADLCADLNDAANVCFSDFAADFPSVAEKAPPGC